jgi:glycosyltransferase involved in cell wall biosynthesis
MRISIVIPAYNGERWILAAVQSALRQDLIDQDGLPELYQVIVRDDGSTDGTLFALEFERDSRLKVIKGEHCGTIGASFQAAFDLADTEFVTVLGQDDLIDRNYLTRVLAEFKGDVNMVSCHPRFIDESFQAYNNPADPRCRIPKPVNMPSEELLKVFNIGNLYFGINTYRRQAVIDAGGFDPKAGWLIDLDLYTRIAKAGSIHVIEEELSSLMLRDGSTSNLNNSQAPVQHKYQRYVREKNFRPTKMKVAIATPFYMSQEWSHYGESMIHTCHMLTQAGIPWELIRINGDSYVDRAKNTAVANFLESDCTDLIMIDSDEQWHPEAISRLLQHPEEIVVGLYPFKNNWGQFAGNPLIVTRDGKQEYSAWRPLSDGSIMLEAYNIGGGFTRIKRSALEKYADFYENDVYLDEFAWPMRKNRIYTMFFMCDVVDFQRYGEDAYFSRRMRAAGIRLWIDPNITITHYGTHGWTGNFHDSIVKSPEEIERLMKEQLEARGNQGSAALGGDNVLQFPPSADSERAAEQAP